MHLTKTTARSALLGVAVLATAAVAAFPAARAGTSGGSAPDGSLSLRLRGTFTAETPERVLPVRLLGGGSFRARVRTLTPGTLPTLALRTPGGDVLAVARPAGPDDRRTTLEIPTLPDDATGACALVVSGTDDTAFELVVRARPPRTTRHGGVVVPAGGTVVLPFAGDTRSVVAVRLRASGETLPAAIRVTTPRGSSDTVSGDAIGAAARLGRTARVTLTGGAGTYGLVLTGGVEDAVVDVDLSVRGGSVPDGTDLADTTVDEAFTFEGSRPGRVTVTAEADGRPLAGEIVRVLTPRRADGLGGDTLEVGVTGPDGRCTLTAHVPFGTDRIVVALERVGMPNRRVLDVQPSMEVSFR